jgi:putative ABC transport system ATP-binding protein
MRWPNPIGSSKRAVKPRAAGAEDGDDVRSSLAVDARAVSKTFGAGPLAFKALHEVDFQVARGELVMLSGPSGSGKTTLLSIVGCVLRPSSGELRLFGQSVGELGEAELPALRAALVGFVFQGHNLIASLSALENVSVLARLRGVPKRQADAEARALLAQVGLADRASHLPAELSGGQRQRVAVARALIGSPPLVLADEPTAALDAAAGLEVTRLLASLSRERGSTVVVVTHDPRIHSFADRVVHIDDGRVVEARGEAA